MKNITVIGAGYVGLVTAACLAKVGHHVTCVDTDSLKIQNLCAGSLPFYEPGLQELVHQQIADKRLKFTTEYKKAIASAQVCFLALPTPSNQDESCNISYVLQAAQDVAEVMEDYLVVVNKSTVPVGTCQAVKNVMQKVLQEKRSSLTFDVVANPEFLCEGTAVRDCMQPDRILIGNENQKALQIMQEVFAPWKEKIQVLDIASAELAKYAANAMLALRLSFMNDLSNLCEKLDADVGQVQKAIGADQRIGARYLNPGIGFGGSCLPKDVKALIALAKEHSHPTSFLENILEINTRQLDTFFLKIYNLLEGLEGKRLCILGLSFKPETDDLREAPSLALIQKCLQAGAYVQLYDPVAMEKAKYMLPQDETVQFYLNEYAAAKGAHAIILLTEWEQFALLDFEKIGQHMQTKIIFDGRNLYDGAQLEKLGFTYLAIGKKSTPMPVLQT